MRIRLHRKEERRGTGSEETDHHTGRRRRIAVGTTGAHLIRTRHDLGVLPCGHGGGAPASLCPPAEPGGTERDEQELYKNR